MTLHVELFEKNRRLILRSTPSLQRLVIALIPDPRTPVLIPFSFYTLMISYFKSRAVYL